MTINEYSIDRCTVPPSDRATIVIGDGLDEDGKLTIDPLPSPNEAHPPSTNC